MNGKSKKLAVVLFAISVIAATLFGASCKNRQNSTETGAAKDAVYYCVADSGEYVVSLTKDKTYILSVAGDYKYGGYTLAENGELKLIVDGNEVAATITNDELAITYGGKSYTLLEKIDRKVTFEDNGVTTVATVLNGKTVAKPADPEDKDGEKFVGWYTSAEYKEVYNFAMPVRTDTTVYAQHVKLTAGAKEFTVTLKNGSDEKITTTNGVLYNLKPLAAKDGKEFDGWYVSDFNDEAKLTYKYNGEVLKQNVNLYPVWKDEISGVSVTENRISWEADGMSFDVKITDADNVSDPQRVTKSYLDYEFKKKGEYKIEISKTGSDKVVTAYYNSRALARVSDITVLEGGMLSYNTVENAERYIVTVECGNSDHRHSGIDNKLYTYFDISGCEMKAGGIKVIVVAEAKDYVTSQSEAFYYEKKLEKVAAVAVKDGKLVWSQVGNALGYVVTVNGEKFEVGNVTEYSLKNYAAGEYELGVYPVTKGYNSPEAATIPYNKDKLATPAGVAVNGNVIKWNEVDGAKGYELNVNDRIFLSDNSTFNLKDEYFTNGAIQLKIKAIGITTDENSDYTDTINVSYNSLTGLNYANGVFSWNPVFVAGRYEVSVNGTDVVETDAEKTNVDIKFKKSGSNEIMLKYFFDDGSAGQVKSIYVNTYTVRFVGNNGQTEEIYIAKGDEIKYSDLSVAGYELNGWYNVPSGGENNGLRITAKTLEKSSDLIMYAYYVSRAYEVTLDELDETVSVRFNEAYTLPVPLSDDVNFTFGGWYSGINGTDLAYTDADGVGLGKWSTAYPITLYPSWIKVFEYTLDNSGKGYRVVEGPGLPYVTSAVVQSSVNGKPVLSIDSLANATRLKTITIPDTANITLGANLGVSSSVFAPCSSLESIVVQSTGTVEAPKYCSDGGVLYSVTYKNGDDGESIVAAKTLIIVPLAKRGILELAYDTTAIANYALSGSFLEKVIIPATVTSVGDGAFANCMRLTEIKFLAEEDGEKVEELKFGKLVFDGCESLKILTLPGRLAKSEYVTADTVSKQEWSMDFDMTMLADSKGLEEINFVGKTINYSSLDGMIASVDGSTVIYCPKGRTRAVNLPETVTTVANGAFKSCTLIPSVTIPGSVTYIGIDAFRSCSEIAELKFMGDANDEGLTIDTGAIYLLSKLTAIELPENLICLMPSSIYGSSLKTITVNSVGKLNADGNYELDFRENACGSITTGAPYFYTEILNIGAKVPSIGIAGVFGYSLKTVNVDSANNNYTTLGDTSGGLYNSDGSRLLYYPLNGAVVFNVPDGVKELSANVFRTNTILTEVYIPASIEKIGDNAFYNCTKIKKITIAEGESSLEIGDYAFYYCSLLKEIVLPARLKSLGRYAFYYNSTLKNVTFNGTAVRELGNYTFSYCKELKNIDLPESLETLGDYVFSGCYKLTTVNLPSTLTEMGKDVFNYCYNLSDIVIAKNNETYATKDGILYKKTDDVITELIYCPLSCGGVDGVVNVPDTVEKVVDSAFYNNKLIEQVIFSDLEEGKEIVLGQKLFYGTKNLKTIRLPEGLKTINRNVFWQSGAEEVTIPGSVTRIEAEGFYNAINLKKLIFAPGTEDLVIADGVTTSGMYSSGFGAFYGCRNLEELILPERTTEIGAYAFYMSSTYGSKLKKVYIPSKVAKIGKYAFYYCNNLSELTFGENSKLTEIPEYAFYMNVKLKNVVLPDTIVSTGYYSFAQSGLTNIGLPASVKTIGGNITDNKGKVTGVGGYSFYKCNDLKKVTINSIEAVEINDYSFANCGKLSDVKVAGLIKTVGDYAFYETEVTSFRFPSTIESIGKYAFMFTNLTEIGFDVDETTGLSSLAQIGDNAFTGSNFTTFELPKTTESVELGKALFKGNKRLRKITLPSSQTSIGEAFSGCVSIEEIVVDESNQNMSVADGILYNADHTSVYYVFKEFNGELIIPTDMEVIAEGAYMGQVNITKVVIPEKVRAIGKNAFKNCTSLREVVFSGGTPSLREISEGSFEGCSSLIGIDLPLYITTIGDNAFKNCTALSDIELHDNVNVIGESAFENTGLKSIEIPKSLKFINAYAFAGTKLNTVTIPATVEKLGTDRANDVVYNNKLLRTEKWSDGYVFSNCESLTEVIFAEGSPITEWGDGIFKDCTALTKVTIKGTDLKQISEYSFSGCSSLVKIEIPEGVTNIKAYAFYGCSKLSSVKLPSTLKTMCSDMKYPYKTSNTQTIANNLGHQFENCTSLKNIEIPEGVTYIGTFAFANSGLVRIELPSTLKYLTARNQSLSKSSASFQNGMALTSLTSFATYEKYMAAQFANCADLEEVILPAKLDSLGVRTFWNTPKLKKITYSGASEDGNVLPVDLKYVGGFQFAQSGLEEIKIPTTLKLYNYVFSESGLNRIDLSDCMIKEVPQYTFKDAKALTEVVLPDSVEKICMYAFQSCTSLASLELPQKLTYIDNYAFRYSGLVTIDLSGVTTYGKSGYQFAECASLRAVTLSSDLDVLPNYMFNKCKSLKGINIPSSVSSIGSSCFLNSGLKTVHLSANVVNIEDNAFATTTLNEITVDPENSRYMLIKGILADKSGRLILCPAGKEFENDELVIPEEVTDIAKYTFNGNQHIKRMVLPASLKEIPQYSIAYAYALEEVVIPDGVTVIHGYAFRGCRKLESVKIPSSVNSIGTLSGTTEYGYTFAGCLALKTVDLSEASENLTFYGSYTFSETAIESIDLARFEMSEMPNSMFSLCVNLKEIKFPQGLIYMGDETFSGCTSIETVEIPASVKYLAGSSTSDEYSTYTGQIFFGCTNLTDVRFLGNEVVAIGFGSFGNCTSLENLELPSSVKFIEGYTYTVNSKSQPCGAFMNTPIREITIPESVNVLDDYAFLGCKNLITINGGENITTIGKQVFEGCMSLKSYTVNESVIAVGDRAFADSGLESVDIKSEIVTMGDSLFEDCKSLMAVSMTKEIKTLSKAMFKNCILLKQITLPSDIRYIPAECFEGSGIERVIIPDSVNVIHENAFADCKALTIVELGEGVKEICRGAFANCTAIDRLVIPAQVYNLNAVSNAKLQADSAFYGWTSEQTIEFELSRYQTAKLFDADWGDGCNAVIAYN